MNRAIGKATADGGREWRDGWILVFTTSFGVGIVAIPTYTIGLFVAPLSENFGWTISAIVLAQTLYALTVGFTSPLAGIAMDRFGARPLALGGAALLCLLFGLLALSAGSLAQFYGLWLLMALATTITSPMIWLKAIVDRFDRHRGLANSIALCGSNVAGGIAPLLAAFLISQYGWQTAYVGLACYMFITAIPLGLIYYHDQRSLDRKSFRAASEHSRVLEPTAEVGLSVKEAVRTREFWALLISFFFAGAGITGFVVHFVPLAISKGIPTILAAGTVTAFSIAAIVGRIGAGWLMDRIFAPRLATGALLLPLAAGAMLLGSPGYGIALAAAALIGLSTGAEYNMISYLTVRYFGFRRYGTISSYLNTTFTFGCTTGPLLAAWRFTASGSYDEAILLLSGCFGLAAMFMLFCGPYPASKSRTTAEPAPAAS